MSRLRTTSKVEALAAARSTKQNVRRERVPAEKHSNLCSTGMVLRHESHLSAYTNPAAKNSNMHSWLSRIEIQMSTCFTCTSINPHRTSVQFLNGQPCSRSGSIFQVAHTPQPPHDLRAKSNFLSIHYHPLSAIGGRGSSTLEKLG
jgi:hypothetical protein